MFTHDDMRINTKYGLPHVIKLLSHVLNKIVTIVKLTFPAHSVMNKN